MINMANIKFSNEVKHLFIPANKSNEVLWLLKNAKADMDKIAIVQWRKVVDNQVPELEHITEAKRNAEIDMIYGEYAKYVKTTPAAILTYYDVRDLFQELYKTLLEDGDPDYIAYFEGKQEDIREEVIMAKNEAYVVFEGTKTGVIYNWPETEEAVKGVKGAKYKGYKTEKEAKEAWANYQANKNKEFDLLICADGSANFTINKEDEYWGRDIDERYVSYGAIVISNKNKRYYIESGVIRDTKELEFSVERFDVECKSIELEKYNYEDVYKDDPKEEDRRNKRRHTMAGAGYSDTAELEGVRRIIDIASKIGKDETIQLVHDFEDTPTMYNGTSKLNKNGAYYYGKRFEELRALQMDIDFKAVNSHVLAPEELRIHAALNDCTDILAKAETTDRPIGGTATHKKKTERVNGNAEWALGRQIARAEFKHEIVTRKELARNLTKEVVAKLYPDYKLVNSFTDLI